jgi:hypothetical protein
VPSVSAHGAGIDGCSLARPGHPACSLTTTAYQSPPRVARAWASRGVSGVWTVSCQRPSTPDVPWTRGGDLSTDRSALRKFPADAQDCQMTVSGHLKHGTHRGELWMMFRPQPH